MLKSKLHILLMFILSFSILIPNYVSTSAQSAIIKDVDLDYIPGEFLIIDDKSSLEAVEKEKKLFANDWKTIKREGVTKIKSSEILNKLIPNNLENGSLKKSSVSKTKKLEIESYTSKFIEKLASLGLKVEPNYLSTPDGIINDPSFNLQWYMENAGQSVTTGFSGGWFGTTPPPTVGTPGVDIKARPTFDLPLTSITKVAVIDTVFDINHEDLSTSFLPGYDFGENDNNVTSNIGEAHGTFVSGLISAKLNNNIGMAGICQKCSIIPYKASNAQGFLAVDAIISSLTAAKANGAKVVNISSSSPNFSQAYNDKIQELISSGISIVASAGNTSANADRYPASYDNVISVAGTNNQDIKVSNSTFGSKVTLSAPGQGIYTTLNGNQYVYLTGTSYAAPLVAGTIGLMISQNNTLTPAQIKSILQATSVNINSLNPTFAGLLGSGRLNTLAAVQAAQETPFLTYQNITTGEPTLESYNLAGSVFNSQAPSPTFNSPEWKVVKSIDMNNDGGSDLVWVNSNNGQTVVWYLNASGAYIGYRDYGAVGTTWKLVDVARLNNDVTPDFVWQNINTGMPLYWTIAQNGDVINGAIIPSPTFNSPEWKVVKSIDMNNDGASDLVWLNDINGQTVVWYMNANGAILGYRDYGAVGTIWKLVDVARLNNDVTPDFVWQNINTGMPLYWTIAQNGDVINGGISPSPTFNAPGWKIIKSTDMNNDGAADLVWQEATVGTVVVWYMNSNGAFISSVALNIPNVVNKKLIK